MKTKNDLNNIIERAATEIRDEGIDPSVVAGAADRVWKRLSERAVDTSAAQVDHIRNCADFQALIPSYLGGTLSSARSLLLEDHTHECVPCRRAMKEARHGVSASSRILEANLSRPSSSRRTVMRWAIAAAVVITVLSGVTYQRFTRVTDAFHSMVYAMEGPVYSVSAADTKPLTVGDEIPVGQTIRTAKDAGAVLKLPDGSLIEMRERSEFSVTNNSDGTTIHLDRGNIIVQAAKQGSKHLFVQTADGGRVSVKGTVFSVNAGTKGSRVSVVEGEVHVEHSRKTDVLRAGDQVTTSLNLDRIPVKDEIAWSRDAERYGKVLAEAAALRADVDSRVQMPGVRYSTRLLDMAPADAVFFVAIPNLSATLAESNKIIQERLDQNADLREWWDKDRGSAGGQQLFDRAITKISEFGEQLGDEIVVTAQLGAQREPGDPLVLTTLKDPAGFQGFVNRQLEQLGKGKQPSIKFIDNPAAAISVSAMDAANPDVAKGKKGRNNSDLFVWINGDVLAASPQLSVLAQAADRARTASSGRSEFLSKIADVYQEGAGFIIAADLEKIIAGSGSGDSKSADAMNKLGITSLKHFIVEMKEDQGKTFNRAVLTFSEQRRGIASWLAAPGPMGALQYISPDATVVAAFVVSNPVALVDDLFAALNSIDPRFSDEISRFNAETGLDIRRDFAAPLGGEFAFAIDGPVLPTPSWKLVFEVNDPVHLQQTFERVVDKINDVAHREGKQGFAWDRSDSGGLTYYTLRSLDYGLEITYTYVNGYLVAGPSRALVDRAVSYHDQGYTLLHSPRFMAALPDDKQANFSALVYQNLQPVFGPIARGMGGAAANLPAEGQQALKQLSGSVPVLAYAYAQGDRITFAVNGENGPIGLKPSNLLGMPGSFGLQNIIKQSMR